jgi:AbiV family abortive infection protein
MLSDIEVSAKDCLSNAERHLAAAKALRGLRINFTHIAYHNAVICLEEVGKALIVRMTHSAGDNRTTLRNWVDDHSVSYGLQGLRNTRLRANLKS